jgi:non-ribosomal peptide synthetase component F
MFSLEPSLPAVDPAWQLTQMDIDTGATKYDLYLELDERSDTVLARFHYSTDLFDQTTIVRMSEHWTRLLSKAVLNASVRISQLPLLSDEETKQVVEQWNEAATLFPAREDYSQRFRRTVCTHP